MRKKAFAKINPRENLSQRKFIPANIYPFKIKMARTQEMIYQYYEVLFPFPTLFIKTSH